jgi:hypothetical protein
MLEVLITTLTGTFGLILMTIVLDTAGLPEAQL